MLNVFKYVRDCLEVLRIGAGLDVGKRVRRGNVDRWNYIYQEDADIEPKPMRNLDPWQIPGQLKTHTAAKEDLAGDLVFDDKNRLEPSLHLADIIPYNSYPKLGQPCDPDYSRLFHIFWAGPFTDKPYMAVLSFLYTQNTGLHLQEATDDASNVCRPKFLIWINPGPAASVPNPNALHDMYDSLAANPWSAPFLHPRFREVVEFRLWNTCSTRVSSAPLRSSASMVFAKSGSAALPAIAATSAVCSAMPRS